MKRLYDMSGDFVTITVRQEDGRFRLDKFLTGQFSEKSRTYFQYLIDNKDVIVNNTFVKKGYELREGDVIQVRFSLPPDTNLTPEAIPLDIIYEDEFFLAVNKPSGMVVHPAPGNWSGTLVNGLLHYCHSIENPENSLRPGIVHRLDKDTSGVLLVAKTYEAQKKIVEMFAERKIKKQYLSICIGNPGNVEVRAAIGRHPVFRKKMSVSDKGKDALSIFRTVAFDENFSLVKVRLETGRTHQIRVHSRHLGTPILGDATYGDLHKNKKYNVNRQMLHAEYVRFIHPFKGDCIELYSSVPDDMSSIIGRLFH